MGHDPHSAAEVGRAVFERLTGAGVAFVAPRRCWQDLQQAIPAPAAAHGPRPIGAFVFGQCRHKANPEIGPLLCIRCRIGRAPFGNIGRHQIGQRSAVGRQRRQGTACPCAVSLHVLPPCARQHRTAQRRAQLFQPRICRHSLIGRGHQCHGNRRIGLCKDCPRTHPDRQRPPKERRFHRATMGALRCYFQVS